MRYLSMRHIAFLNMKAAEAKDEQAKEQLQKWQTMNRKRRRALAAAHRGRHVFAKSVWCQAGGLEHKACLRSHPGDGQPNQRGQHHEMHGASMHPRRGR